MPTMYRRNWLFKNPRGSILRISHFRTCLLFCELMYEKLKVLFVGCLERPITQPHTVHHELQPSVGQMLNLMITVIKVNWPSTRMRKLSPRCSFPAKWSSTLFDDVVTAARRRMFGYSSASSCVLPDSASAEVASQTETFAFFVSSTRKP